MSQCYYLILVQPLQFRRPCRSPFDLLGPVGFREGIISGNLVIIFVDMRVAKEYIKFSIKCIYDFIVGELPILVGQ